jgi:LPXTG-motif cell wall-anchored protein
MGSLGPDVESGHGFINADAALAELVTPTVITLPDRCKPVTLSVDSVTKKEGNSGNAIFTFKVTKLGNAAQDVTVAFATADGTAKKDSDYKEKAGTLTFTPTDVSKTVDVEVAGDTVVEPDEMFDLTLADVTPVNTVRLTNTFGTATIDDDDDPASQGSPDSKLDFVTWGVPSESKASPGDKVKIDGTGFKADALLTGTLYSTPITLGTINATAAGAFAATVIIPDGATNGDHEIHIVGTDAGGGTRTIRYPITIVNAVSESAAGGSSGAGTGSSGTEVVGAVTSTSVLPTTAAAAAPVALPATGANITFLTELGSLLLMAGLVLVYGTRRRHSR